MHTTNYIDTFIEVAVDSPAVTAMVPPAKSTEPTAAGLQYELVHAHPYRYTSDDVFFAVHARRTGVAKKDAASAREAFFAKGQACMRASPLTKRYGWGVHSDGEGRIALYAVESPDYARLAADPSLKHVKAMRAKRG